MTASLAGQGSVAREWRAPSPQFSYVKPDVTERLSAELPSQCITGLRLAKHCEKKHAS